jgi:hypothetical protein
MNSKNITIETLKKVRAHIAFWEHGHPVVVQDIDDLFEVTYNEETLDIFTLIDAEIERLTAGEEVDI